MPKWTSPIFTDIRNALGESVVFSMWKGRPYMRSWVRPSNPKTNKQQANRSVLSNIIKRYQTVVSTDDITAEWNKEALSYTISGFNVFTKFGMKASIACPLTGSTAVASTVTYTAGMPALKARVFALKDGATLSDITPAENLVADKDATFDHTFTEAGVYDLFIADKDVLVEGDSTPMAYQAVTNWSRDNLNGVAKAAKITISA